MSGLLIWAQSQSTSGSTASPIPPTPTGSLVSLAIRRWFGSGTLSPSTAEPNFDVVLVVMGGLLLLFLYAGLRQGFLKAFAQFLDLPGHLRLFRAAVDRLQRSSRIVAVTIGMTVLVWTGDQMLTFSDPRGREDLQLLLKSRGLGELAVEHGVLTSLIPWRDVFSMGDFIPLMLLAAPLIFQAAAKAAANPYILARSEKPTLSAWATVAWGSAALSALYRIAGLIAGSGDLPLGGCAIPIEAPFVPVLLVLADGLILSWILVEMRNASLGDVGNEVVDADGIVQLYPVSCFACALALPGRYLSTFAWLLLDTAQTYIPGSWLTSLLRWEIIQGVMYQQGFAFLTVGVAGAAAWTRGSPWAGLVGYSRLIKAEGGRLVATLLSAAVVAGSLAGLVYSIVLELPTQSWVLAAADSYAHYATLPVGVLTLAALVELGERTLPSANLAEGLEVQAASEA